jgi:hypothetical protein
MVTTKQKIAIIVTAQEATKSWHPLRPEPSYTVLGYGSPPLQPWRAEPLMAARAIMRAMKTTSRIMLAMAKKEMPAVQQVTAQQTRV